MYVVTWQWCWQKINIVDHAAELDTCFDNYKYIIPYIHYITYCTYKLYLYLFSRPQSSSNSILWEELLRHSLICFWRLSLKVKSVGFCVLSFAILLYIKFWRKKTMFFIPVKLLFCKQFNIRNATVDCLQKSWLNSLSLFHIAHELQNVCFLFSTRSSIRRLAGAARPSWSRPSPRP